MVQVHLPAEQKTVQVHIPAYQKEAQAQMLADVFGEVAIPSRDLFYLPLTILQGSGCTIDVGLLV